MLLQNWRKSILNKYSVELMPRVYRDIEEIYAYEKLSPENAKGQINRIKEAILGLDTLPESKRILKLYQLSWQNASFSYA